MYNCFLFARVEIHHPQTVRFKTTFEPPIFLFTLFFPIRHSRGIFNFCISTRIAWTHTWCIHLVHQDIHFHSHDKSVHLSVKNKRELPFWLPVFVSIMKSDWLFALYCVDFFFAYVGIWPSKRVYRWKNSGHGSNEMKWRIERKKKDYWWWGCTN